MRKNEPRPGMFPCDRKAICQMLPTRYGRMRRGEPTVCQHHAGVSDVEFHVAPRRELSQALDEEDKAFPGELPT